MLRQFVCGFACLFLGIGLLLGDEVKGKVKKSEKGTITVTVDGKDTDYKIAGAKLFKGDSEVTDKKEKGKTLKEIKEGDEVTIVFEKDGDKVKVKEVKLK